MKTFLLNQGIFLKSEHYLVSNMCICPRVSTSNSIYDLPAKEKENLSKKLPQLSEKRLLMVTKHILFNFLENLADFIFTNGKIYTMDAKNPEVEAVAIKGQDILFAGKMAEAIIYKGEKTKVIDLKGRTMLPGFIDPHVHMCFTMFKHWLDLSPFTNKNLQEVKEKLGRRIEELEGEPNEWITAQLFDPTILQGEFDTSIKNLDKMAPNNPVFILQANGHIAHVNSRAFQIAGITNKSADPLLGRFVRTNQGQLTGELQQTALMVFKQFLLRPADSYMENFKFFLRHCSSKGCTSLNDCGIGLIDPKADLAVLLDAMQNDPPVRYSGYLVSTHWDVWMEQQMIPEYKDQLLRIHGIKCWADGSLQGGSAFLRQKYLQEQWGKGNANYSLEELTESIKKANDKGWQVGVHANGDAGIDMVLKAYEQAIRQNPRPELRHRIEHCTVCHKDQLQKMKELNISPSFLIGHIYYYGYAFKHKILGLELSELIDPLKSANQLGLRPSVHSDYNCQPVDPIRCLYNAVTRKMKYNNQVLNSKQCLTPYEAVQALTLNAAWQCHLEDIVGSLEKGKKADFVILDRNPMSIPQSQLLSIEVMETWMNGARRYKSELKTSQSFNSQPSSSLNSESLISEEGS